MGFEEFVDVVKNEIGDYLLQYDIDNIYVEEVRKNNGIKLTGLIIAIKGEKIFPNIYLESYYEMVKNGKDIEDIIKLISTEYKKAKELLGAKCNDIDEIEILKEKIFIKVVNYEKNKEQLSNCPYILFHDLAITFRYLVSINNEGISSAQLRNPEMARLGMNLDDLYEIALANTKELFPPVLKRLGEMLATNLQDETLDCEDNQLYILTNKQGINGASYIVYEDMIKEFAEEHDTDLFILPSSVHEILLLPVEDNMDREELVEMVQEVNCYAVPDLDYLSDNVYFYDRNIGKIIE